MKKLLLFLVMGMFFLSFASALSFDNRKSFDEKVGEYGRATITNAFGFGGKIMDVDLIENSEVCLNNFCEASGKIEVYQSSRLIDEVRFRESKDLEETSSSIKDYSVLIKSDKEWETYNGEVLSPGSYEWQISGRIKPGQSLDWVGKWAGLEIPEWAIWTSEYQIRIIASTLNISQFSINNVVVTDEGSGVWKVNSTEGDQEVSRAQIMKTLFYGTDGTDPRILNTTGVTSMVSLDDRDIGQRGYFVSFFKSVGSATTGNVTGSFDVRTDNNVSSWSYVQATMDVAGGSATMHYELPAPTVLNTVTANPTDTTTSDETGTDKTADQKVNPESFGFIYSSTGGQPNTGTGRVILLMKGNLTFLTTNVLVANTDFTFNHSIPAFVSNPSITLSNPLDNAIVITSQSLNFSANFTSLNQSLANTSLFLDAVLNETIDITGATNSTNFTKAFSSLGNITWYIEACDDLDACSQTTNRTLQVVEMTEINFTFENVTSEGSLEDFEMVGNLSDGITVTSANLIYNGTSTPGTIISPGSNIVFINKENFQVPTLDANTNLSFFWSVLFSNSNTINFTARNQTVNQVAIGNCSTFSNTLLNFTVVDEEFQTTIPNATIEISTSLFSEDRQTSISNFTSNTNSTNPLGVCIEDPIPIGITYSLDTVVKYSATNYSIEYYNIVNSSFTSGTNGDITLFDLLLVDATEFKITFKDADFIVVEGALINVNRQYIPEDVFKTVELPITDSNGQTVVHLVEKDIVYNFIVSKGGRVIGTFNNLIAFCDDVTIGSCFISLNAVESNTQSFDYSSKIGISFNFDYNETSRELDFTFVSDDGTSKVMILNATKLDQIGSTSVCADTITSASGTLTCTIPASIGNSSIYASVFVDGDLKLIQTIKAGSEISLGFDGYFLLFFWMISLIMMFSSTKSGVVIAVIIGFISGILFFLIEGSVVGSVSSIVWLVIAGLILLWKLNKEGQT